MLRPWNHKSGLSRHDRQQKYVSKAFETNQTNRKENVWYSIDWCTLHFSSVSNLQYYVQSCVWESSWVCILCSTPSCSYVYVHGAYICGCVHVACQCTHAYMRTDRPHVYIHLHHAHRRSRLAWYWDRLVWYS